MSEDTTTHRKTATGAGAVAAQGQARESGAQGHTKSAPSAVVGRLGGGRATAARLLFVLAVLWSSVPAFLEICRPCLAPGPTTQVAEALAVWVPKASAPAADANRELRWTVLLGWASVGVVMALAGLGAARRPSPLPDKAANPPRCTEKDVYSAEVALRRGESAAGTWADLPDSFGVALSGGGVRAASFAFGALQALAATGLLRRVDIISSVSGGGYAAMAWLHQWPQDQEARLPFGREDEGQRDTQGVAERANYLNPAGLPGLARAVSAVLRGPLVHGLIGPIPLILAAGWLLAFLGATPSPVPETWFSRAGVLGVLLLVGGLLLGAIGRRPLERWSHRDTLSLAIGSLSVLLLAFAALPVALRSVDDVGSWGAGAAAGAGGAALAMAGRLWSAMQGGALRRLTRPIAFALLGLLTLVLPVAASFGVAVQLLHWPSTWPAWPILWLSVTVTGAVLAWTYDINANALGRHYREALATAFIGSRQMPPPSGPGGRPLHLVNATLNARPANEKAVGPPRLRGHSFTFGDSHVGAREVGWAPREHWDRWTGLDAADRMAISGAVASPTMGRYSLPAARVLMTLLNLRMGQWVPHPGTVPDTSSPKAKAPSAPFPAVPWLVREATSAMRPDAPWLYLTDGGHEENLGVLELLRRRFRLIVAIDAEGDAERNFGGLFRLIELARRLESITIDIDVEALRPDSSGISRRHAAIGTIRYPGSDPQTSLVGTLLYVKASRTGHEQPIVQAFARQQPEFPHHSTANQFFSPAHFEAYRNLGYRAVRDLMPSNWSEELPPSAQALMAWVQRGAKLRYRLDPTGLGKGPDLGAVLASIAALCPLPPGTERAMRRLACMQVAEASLDLRDGRPDVSRTPVLAAFRDWCGEEDLALAVRDHGHHLTSQLRRLIEELGGPARAVALRPPRADGGPDAAWQVVVRAIRPDGQGTPERDLCQLTPPVDGRSVRLQPALNDPSLVFLLAEAIIEEPMLDTVVLTDLLQPDDLQAARSWFPPLEERRKRRAGG